jgi:predicted metal-dependent enzyme (double-stranded beta helix superfamily)
VGFVATWLDDESAVDWTNLRDVSARSRDLLDRLADDRELLSELVFGIEHDELRLRESEVHPLINRLILYQADDRGITIRLHMSPGARELVPHDHKYTFTARVLTGAYVHVWRRKDAEVPDFESGDLAPGVVTIERPGSAYTFGHQLVHQTIMVPGTVTLFMRGPRMKDRSHAALDMLPQADKWDRPFDAGKPKHARGQRPVTRDEYLQMRADLVGRGLIDDPRTMER